MWKDINIYHKITKITQHPSPNHRIAVSSNNQKTENTFEEKTEKKLKLFDQYE
jgi:hypothetical protein